MDRNIKEKKKSPTDRKRWILSVDSDDDTDDTHNNGNSVNNCGIRDMPRRQRGHRPHTWAVGFPVERNPVGGKVTKRKKKKIKGSGFVGRAPVGHEVDSQSGGNFELIG